MTDRATQFEGFPENDRERPDRDGLSFQDGGPEPFDDSVCIYCGEPFTPDGQQLYGHSTCPRDRRL